MTARLDTPSDLDHASFQAIADLVYRECGLTLVKEKYPMIQSRLRHRLRDLKIGDFSSYCALIHSDAGTGERANLISALTTNVSNFFREKHHFDTLTSELGRKLAHLRAGQPWRIWSAGCSNGQEALSAAMTILERVPEAHQLDIRILATDIDAKVVRFARAGVYPEHFLHGVSETLLHKYFDREGAEGAPPRFAAKPALMNLIRFNELNLLARWPMRRRFDLIFCRNVVIYFDLKTQEALWPRFRQVLHPDGHLFLGHSERIANPGRFGFDCTGPTTYRPLRS